MIRTKSFSLTGDGDQFHMPSGTVGELQLEELLLTMEGPLLPPGDLFRTLPPSDSSNSFGSYSIHSIGHFPLSVFWRQPGSVETSGPDSPERVTPSRSPSRASSTSWAGQARKRTRASPGPSESDYEMFTISISPSSTFEEVSSRILDMGRFYFPRVILFEDESGFPVNTGNWHDFLKQRNPIIFLSTQGLRIQTYS